MFSKWDASLLITGTTSAPPFTGSVPPSTKQFCTSTTISADLASGLMVPAAHADRAAPSAVTRQREAVDPRKRRRERTDEAATGEAATGMATSRGRRGPSLASMGTMRRRPIGNASLGRRLSADHG